jgi:hypothetical protein
MSERNLKLAADLSELAELLRRNPASVIGSQITVKADGNTAGSIIGERISVTAGPGSRGSVIGKSVSVYVTGRSQDELDLISELNDASEKVREDAAPSTWLLGLLKRVGNIGVDVVSAAAVAITTNYFGS